MIVIDLLPVSLFFIKFLNELPSQLGLLQKIAKRKSDPRVYADELGKGFVGELDYTLEAANALKFRVINVISI